ncbi:RagB/SusD family nutrient uptake outer membrane protein [Prolixibacteraceae bacterium JC049]|nr:RagB/SusD family nutrient uptake outer membrane protein [Prolixibacteraceae bacterium JC049]
MKSLLSLLLALVIITGCDSALDDVKDLGNYPGQGTFDDVQTSNAYLAALYSSSFKDWPVGQGKWSDEDGSIQGLDWITESNGAFNFWPYDIIRRTNILLKEMPVGKVDPEDKEIIIAQAKFIRAFNYFKLVTFYGGVPIITTPQELTDDLEVTRNSTAECFDFILKDLDEAIAALPDQFTGGERGKIDKAIALSFKGRVLLFKASPQFNPSNKYDNQYWAKAYEANKAAKDFLDSKGYGLLENYTDIFETEGHKENIFSIIYQDPIKTNGRREDAVRPLSESKNATGEDQPIWKLAQAYPMKDGKKISDATSKYTYDMQTFWKDRDPRFEATIVWNGALYELSGKAGRRQYTMTNIAASVDAFGFVIQGESHYRTGLYCRKGINESLTSALVTTNDFDWTEIRYAEVLFNYAEAANETGKSTDAVAVLKQIRKRAGIEAGDDNMYGLQANMSREEVREAILAEKYIEMAFEGKRFWDLRRHRMLDRLDGMRKYGIMAMTVNGNTYDKVTPEQEAKAANYELLPEDFHYEVQELITNGQKETVMPEKYYFFPIKLEHIDKNPKLEQNKAWGGSFNPEL